MLVADDDNNDLSDGTPHDTEICNAFTAYGLPESEEIDCPDGAGKLPCPVDFDEDGVFTVFDMLIFSRWLEEGSERADLNRDGRADLFDHLELLHLAAGCP